MKIKRALCCIDPNPPMTYIPSCSMASAKSEASFASPSITGLRGHVKKKWSSSLSTIFCWLLFLLKNKNKTFKFQLQAVKKLYIAVLRIRFILIRIRIRGSVSRINGSGSSSVSNQCQIFVKKIFFYKYLKRNDLFCNIWVNYLCVINKSVKYF